MTPCDGARETAFWCVSQIRKVIRSHRVCTTHGTDAVHVFFHMFYVLLMSRVAVVASDTGAKRGTNSGILGSERLSETG